MPPFNSVILFLKYRKIILDIRDGWSISQESGYGGVVKNKPFKAWVTREIENLIINNSFVTITCTPGLKEHLENLSGCKILLIPNGVSDERIELINKIKLKNPKHSKLKSTSKLVFVCAGQFSEYGSEKVIKLLSTIAARYNHTQTEVRLIGCNEKSNEWVAEFYKKISNGFGYVTFLPKMREEALYENMINADYGLVVVRDPNYDFGTKIYDYIALGLLVINYFDRPNNFTNYFDACLDICFNVTKVKPEIRRSVLIDEGLKDVKF